MPTIVSDKQNARRLELFDNLNSDSNIAQLIIYGKLYDN